MDSLTQIMGLILLLHVDNRRISPRATVRKPEVRYIIAQLNAAGSFGEETDCTVVVSIGQTNHEING